MKGAASKKIFECLVNLNISVDANKYQVVLIKVESDVQRSEC
jgi:hypothetical protein